MVHFILVVGVFHAIMPDEPVRNRLSTINKPSCACEAGKDERTTKKSFNLHSSTLSAIFYLHPNVQCISMSIKDVKSFLSLETIGLHDKGQQLEALTQGGINQKKGAPNSQIQALEPPLLRSLARISTRSYSLPIFHFTPLILAAPA